MNFKVVLDVNKNRGYAAMGMHEGGKIAVGCVPWDQWFQVVKDPREG